MWIIWQVHKWSPHHSKYFSHGRVFSVYYILIYAVIIQEGPKSHIMQEDKSDGPISLWLSEYII